MNVRLWDVKQVDQAIWQSLRRLVNLVVILPIPRRQTFDALQKAGKVGSLLPFAVNFMKVRFVPILLKNAVLLAQKVAS